MASETKFKETEIGMIPEDWNIIRLGEIAEVFSGYAFKSRDFLETGIPVIKIKNITPPNVVLDDVQYVSQLMYDTKEKYRVEYNDILISMTGSNICQFASAVGKVGRVRIKNKLMLLNQRVGKIYSKNSLEYDESFLYHYISTEQTKYMLASIAGGSANQANIDSKQIKNLFLPFPPIKEQIAIGKILDLFYEKIELNYHMNKTLEQIAQILFRRWFIDFEFLDEDGNPYKSSGGRMINSEFGEIPERWKVKKLEDIAVINEDSIKKDYPYDEISYADISSVDNGKLIETTKYETEKSPSRARRIVKNGDVIWSMVRPNRRSYLLILDPQDNLVVSTGFAVISPKTIPYSYLYFWVTTDSFVDYLSVSADGSAYPAVTADRFKEAKVLVPDQNILREFEEFTSPLLLKINFNSTESLKLAKVRDLLLPKLMSGEIRVGY